MRRVRVSPPLRLLPLLALLIASPSLAAWPHDPNDNLPVSRAVGNQSLPASASDGAGGAYIAWRDTRSDAGDIYLQHVNSAGAIALGWPTDGFAVCTAAGAQNGVAIQSDGSGGAYVAWIDSRSGSQDIYVSRVLGNATLAPGWTANGTLASALPGSVGKDDYLPHLAPDATGGVYVVWTLAYSGGDDDVYIARMTSAGGMSAGFPAPVDANGGEQLQPQVIADGSGNAQVVYADGTGTGFDLHYRRIGSAGFSTGDLMVALASNQADPQLVSDGLGGVVVAFSDGEYSPGVVSAVRISGGGALTWGPTKVLNHGGFGTTNLAIATDGARGAYVVGYRGPIISVFVVSHVTSGGSVPVSWPAPGVELGSDFSIQVSVAPDLHGGVLTALGLGGAVHVNRLDANGYATRGWPSPPSWVSPTNAYGAGLPALCDDGSGGAIVAWTDFRNGLDQDLYAQRIEKFGALGNPEPAIAGVKDVANDQGGSVRVSWNASYFDADPVFGVSSYRIWRQVPATTALAALASGRASLEGESAPAGDAGAAGPRPREFRATSLAAQTIYWETIGTQTAAGQPGYSFVASTLGDSVGAGNPRTLFMVEALGYSSQLWDSAPDSGYSVDNLPPAAPAPFTGAYLVSLTHLSWGRNSEADLAGYRLYRGVTPGFVPSSATLIAEQPDTGYVASPGSYYYKLTAIDDHGNESPASLVSPGGTVAVSSSVPAELAFALISANPSRGPTVFRLALPRDANVDARLFDAGGRLVRTLADGALPAGEHTLAWDGRSEGGGNAPPGIYFVRTIAEGRTFGVRIVRLR